MEGEGFLRYSALQTVEPETEKEQETRTEYTRPSCNSIHCKYRRNTERENSVKRNRKTNREMPVINDLMIVCIDAIDRFIAA